MKTQVENQKLEALMEALRGLQVEATVKEGEMWSEVETKEDVDLDNVVDNL